MVVDVFLVVDLRNILHVGSTNRGRSPQVDEEMRIGIVEVDRARCDAERLSRWVMVLRG